METWQAIAVGVVALLVMLIVVPAIVHRVVGPALAARVAKVYRPEQLIVQDLKAMTYGLESLGPAQARGNGALVLTARELHFFQYMPARDVHIPLDAITEVKTVKVHLGKTSGRDLVYVAFTADGRPDSMAWYVPDVSGWIAKLREQGAGTRRLASA